MNNQIIGLFEFENYFQNLNASSKLHLCIKFIGPLIQLHCSNKKDRFRNGISAKGRPALTECENGQYQIFITGDIVWAKLKGWPVWPSKVTLEQFMVKYGYQKKKPQTLFLILREF